MTVSGINTQKVSERLNLDGFFSSAQKSERVLGVAAGSDELSTVFTFIPPKGPA